MSSLGRQNELNNHIRLNERETNQLYQATPASYVAHIWDRDEEAEIALQEIGYTHPFGPQVDILMGGGRCFFMPQSSEGSCRKDNIDALEIAKGYGYSVFSDRQGFDKKQKLPYLGLFTLGKHIPLVN